MLNLCVTIQLFQAGDCCSSHQPVLYLELTSNIYCACITIIHPVVSRAPLPPLSVSLGGTMATPPQQQQRRAKRTAETTDSENAREELEVTASRRQQQQ